MGEFSWENHPGHLTVRSAYHTLSLSNFTYFTWCGGLPGEHARLAASSWSIYLPPDHGEVGAAFGEGEGFSCQDQESL